MITIVTGSINCGKTTRMINLYQANQKGDGFVSIKIMKDGHVDHYRARKLSSGEERVLMIHEKSDSFHTPSMIQIGPYHVIDSTIEWIEDEMNHMINQKISPLYLDEIGHLELKKQGFHHILLNMLHAPVDLVLVIRDQWMKDVVQTYNMNDVDLIDVK